MPELLLPRLKREIEARIAELRPVVAEVAQLEAARRALLEDLAPGRTRRRTPAPVAAPEVAEDPPAPAPSEPPERPPGPRVPRELLHDRLIPREPVMRSSRPARAPEKDENGGAPGGDREVVLALVEERPGVSVAEITAVTKIAKPIVAAIVAKLKREGLLADEAGGVKLASRQPLTLAQVAAAAPRGHGVSDEEWDAAQPGRTKGRAS